MFGDECRCICLRLLHGLLNQLIPRALIHPRLQKSCETSTLLSRDHSRLARLARFRIVLALCCLVGGKFLLNPVALITCRASKILLGIGKLVRIKAKLSLGDVEITPEDY